MPSAFSNWPLQACRYRRCIGAVPGRIYTAPGPVLAVTYNGILLPPSAPAGRLSYTATAEAVTLNFDTEQGDRIDALCLS